MGQAVSQTRAAIAAGKRITVYGDFDVDGVAATSIMVNVLRQIGADCDWFIPDRQSEGYGLNPDAVREIAARGTALLVSVDCGVTSVEEVALAETLGVEAIVTDHHRPGGILPDCTILHPVISDYPFEELCGAAVASKFASALRREVGLDQALDEDDLDLVALATVADVMPLVGENRRLVREGLRVTRRAERPGMRALIRECRLEPSAISSTDFGFRLGPRINAAGRIYRADAGVELFLSQSDERAAEIASELGRANSERRRIEREVSAEAEKARRELDLDDPAALVLAGEGWHPGVVGIVAARFAREHGVPAVIISVDGDQARGSARGVPGLDLHAAIDSVSGLLEGFGGHAAAAGVQLLTERIPEFRDALGPAVAEMVGEAGVSQAERVDAFAGGTELSMDLAEELEKLEPCGKGNPSISLLIPSARIRDVQEIGDGKHCRFTVVSGEGRAAGICFGRTGFGVDEDTPLDLLAELSVNHFNGSSSAQLLVREAFPLPGTEGPEDLPGCGPEEWWQRFEAAMEAGGLTRPRTGAVSPDDSNADDNVITRVDGSSEVVLAEMVSAGEPLLILTSDANSRWRSLGGQPGIARFRALHGRPAAHVGGLWTGSPGDRKPGFAAAVHEGVALSDYETLLRHPDLLSGAGSLLCLDPPASAAEWAVAVGSGATAFGTGDPASLRFALSASADRHELTPALRVFYRDLRDAGRPATGPDGAAGDDLRNALAGKAGSPRSPERAALLLTVLVEAGLARTTGSADARVAGIVSSGGADLSSSRVFSEHQRIHQEQVEFLRQSNR